MNCFTSLFPIKDLKFSSPINSTIVCFPGKRQLRGDGRSSRRREGRGKLNLLLWSIKGEDDVMVIFYLQLLHSVFPMCRKRGRWNKKKRCLGCLESSLKGPKLELCKIMEEGRKHAK